MRNEKIHFVLASDENYIDKLAVSLVSIFKFHTENEIEIHILSNNILEGSLEKITEMSKKYHAVLNVYKVDDIEKLIGKKVNIDHLSLAAYSRIFIPELLSSEIERVIYLDVDIILNSNLESLYRQDLNGKIIGGVKSIIDLSNSKNNIEEFHINSGVILFDLVKCRNFDFVKKCLDFIRSHEGNLPFHDQTVINEVCKTNIYPLSLKYNVMSFVFYLNYKKFTSVYQLKDYYSEEEYNNARKNPNIIHMTSWVIGRPWEIECKHPYQKNYLEYLSITPWSKKPLIPNSKNKYNSVKLAMYKYISADLIRKFTVIKRKIVKLRW